MSKDERLNRLLKGENRGRNVEKVFQNYIKDFKDKSILDVGCGHGSLTIDFAKDFKKVHSIDGGDDQIKNTKKRVENLKNVSLHKDNALYIKSTKDKFDVIHLSGVFEWLRAGDKKKSASQAQKKFLRNIKEHMNDNSILYSGTENKGFPLFWIQDPHNDNWPLMIFLPEKLSDIIFKTIKKKPYTAKIYSYWTLKKMYEKEFKSVDFYVPIPHYQYVYGFANINKPKQIVKECNRVSKNYKLDFRQKVSILVIKYSAKLKLIKLFTPGFITIARKK